MEKTRLYAVSSGNGNDGVSHMFPDYYVRTNDPFRLAVLAMVSSFKQSFKEAAANAVEVYGEADYTISATIYNPEDVDPSEAPERECDCGAERICILTEENMHTANDCTMHEHEDAEHSEDCASLNNDDMSSYCDANGAWQIVEVFPDDEPREGTPTYDSLEDCFGDDDLALVPAD